MNRDQKVLFRIIAVCAALVAAVLCEHAFHMPQYVIIGLYAAIYLLIGYDIILQAVSGIGRGQVFDENFLMVLASACAFATKQYTEAVIVVLLYQIGELFQRYAVGRSRKSISGLMELCPDTVLVKREGTWETVLPEEVEIGQIICVKPGERIALDGSVVSGCSLVDTSALTGESVPRSCQPGSSVLSGSIVMSGMLEICVEKEYADSTAAKILDMVENAAGKKAQTERFITRFSRYYTPVVVLLALLMAVCMPLIDGRWGHWISKAMNFLVISCPCALVISVPMSYFAAIGTASAKGVLVKGGNYLELLGKADTFVFDKTGTLTCGKFSVSDVRPKEDADRVLKLAAIAEQGSLHPIAASILEAAGKPDEGGWEVEELAGYGVIARKNEHTICVGNVRLMQQIGLQPEEVDAAGTVVYVAENGELIGSVEIVDAIKEETQVVFTELKKQGIATVILTGDHEKPAQAVANKLKADHCEAQLLPQDKVAVMEKLLEDKEKGSVVAFVGDGINDAPVLMRADIGIAMGCIGSDAAIEAADVVLMHDRLDAILLVRKIAKKTMTIVRQNIVFAIGIKLLVLLLTPFDLVSLWMAIFADVGVAMLAIVNAMRAGRIKHR